MVFATLPLLVSSAYMYVHTAVAPRIHVGRPASFASSPRSVIAARFSMCGTDSRWDRPPQNRYGDDPRIGRRLQWRLRRLLEPSDGMLAAVMPPPGEVGRLSTVRQLSSAIAHQHS